MKLWPRCVKCFEPANFLTRSTVGATLLDRREIATPSPKRQTEATNLFGQWMLIARTSKSLERLPG